MRLGKRMQAFDEKRAALLDRVQALPPPLLEAKPRAGKWSILEIVEHLALAERTVLQGLPQPSQLAERPRKPKHRFRYFLVWWFLKLRIPVQVPSPAMVPQGNRSLSDIRQLWDESQAWFRAYVGQLDARGLRRAVFRHPVAGPLTPAQAVRLNQIHLDIHDRHTIAPL